MRIGNLLRFNMYCLDRVLFSHCLSDYVNVLVFTFVLLLTFTEQSVSMEYCLLARFSAACNDSQVILMQHARYGRMYAGDCITGETESLGCYGNVLSHLDSQCSGRQECAVAVDYFENIVIGCYKGDRLRFLDAAYICVDVMKEEADEQMCKNNSFNTIDGYIQGLWSNKTSQPSISTEHSLILGTHACPWRIQSLPGQQVRIDMLDITLRQALLENEDYQRDVCPLALVLTQLRFDERVTSRHKLCNQDNMRQSTLLTSAANQIEFYIESHGHIPATQPFFLLYFKVVGCADMALPELMWAERDGRTLLVRCNATGDTWYLVCTDTQWQGEVGNCSMPEPEPEPSEEQDESDSPVSIVIAVAIGVGVGIVVGLSLLGIVVAVLNCCCGRRNQDRQGPNLSQIQVPYSTTDKQIEPYDEADSRSQQPSTSRDSHYSQFSDLRARPAPLPLPPPPPSGERAERLQQQSIYHVYGYHHDDAQRRRPDNEYHAQHGTPMQDRDQYDEHIYESAYFTSPPPTLQQQQAASERHGIGAVRPQGDTVRNHGDTVRHHGDIVRHPGDTVRHQGDTVRHQGDTVRHHGDTREKRQKSLAKEYYEMRESPQSTLDSQQNEQHRY